MSTHALLAPSAAHRWAECTASVMFLEENKDKLPPSGGAHADEGTLAHDLAAKTLTHGGVNQEVSGEMVQHVNNYVSFVRSHLTPESELLVEQRIPLWYDTEMSGTVDAAIIADDRIDICDLKYGAGVSVEAEGNKQLAIYAYSLITSRNKALPEGFQVGLHIFQPRDRNNPEPIRSWNLTWAELSAFCNREIAQAVHAIKAGSVQFRADPQKQCRFCPAKGFCKTFANYGLEALPETIEVLEPEPTLPEPNTLTREQRINVIRARKALEQWLEAVEDQEVAELMNGADTAGYKLVAGKTNRVWADENAAFNLLKRFVPREQLRPPAKLVSPAQVEKLLAGKTMTKRFDTRFASLITKPEGKPSLVPETDKRPALQFNPTATFVNIEEIV